VKAWIGGCQPELAFRSHGQSKDEQRKVPQRPSCHNPNAKRDPHDRTAATGDRDAYAQRDRDHKKGHE